MIHAISPTNSKDFYTFIVQPFIEGAERLNRAWQGIDFHSLTQAKFSLKERTVFLITGFLLTFFPLLNSVIWIAWNTFGHPEILSDPFVPRNPIADPVSIAPISTEEKTIEAVCEEKKSKTLETAQISNPIEDFMTIESTEAIESVQCDKPKIETFSYQEIYKGLRVNSDWKIEFLPDEFRVRIDSPMETTVSRYNKNWEIQEYNCAQADEEMHAVLTDDRHIKIHARRGNRIEERDYELAHGRTWLQQPTLGLRNFLLDPNQKECHFFSIRPDNLDLVEVVTRKTGEEELPGHGKTIRAELKMAHFLLRYFREGELWFDPTGKLVKLIDSGRFMDTNVTELIRNP